MDSSSDSTAARGFGHSIKELEVQVNDILFEGCKIDACIDKFLVRLNHLCPLENGLPEFNNLKLSSSKKLEFEKIKHQLDADLGLWTPGFLDGNSKDGSVDLQSILDRVTERHEAWTKSHDRSSPDKFRSSLLETLAEINHQQLKAHLDPQGQDSAILQENYMELKSSISGQQSSSSFTCGGTIDIETTSGNNNSAKLGSSPVSIFWAVENDSHARKVVLPLNKVAVDSNQQILEQLVKDCSPATFGKGEQDVLDLSYRKAGKMDPAQFAATFDLTKFGILENVEQILLPSISTKEKANVQFRKLRAELYKLNVYSEPSGLFRKHVDTPRSANQVGSLVICLPSQFEGGNLIVRHNGQEVDFDWSSHSSSAIQWAAFYSDCEHEIKTITKGNRITITYNLYITESVGGTLLPNPIVDCKTLPLYGYIKGLMEQPDFMKEGGVFGIFCSHGYAHSTRTTIEGFPRCLKGSDLVLYSVFKSLGIEIGILPVVERNNQYVETNKSSFEGYDYDYECIPRHSWSRKGASMLTLATKCLKEGNKLELYIDNDSGDDFHNCDRIGTRWKVLAMGRRIEGMALLVKDAQANKLDTTGLGYRWDGARVGKALYPYVVTGDNDDESQDEAMRALWPYFRLPGITWLTEPKHKEMALTYLAQGNEATLETRYSCAAIFAVIPPYAKRVQSQSGSNKKRKGADMSH